MKTKKVCIIIIMVSLLLIPIFGSALIVGFHSHELIIEPIHYLSFLIFFFSIAFLITGMVLYFREKKIEETKKKNAKKKIEKEKKGKKNLLKKVLWTIVIGLEWIGACTCLFLLYGPVGTFRSWLIPSAMTTMNHQYFATWFYSEAEINAVLSENQIIESGETTDLNLIHIGENNNTQTFASEYDKEILTKDPDNDVYKIIPISGDGYTGFLAAIYDPSKVAVRTTKYLYSRGQYVTDMASDTKALLAINGGGFIDPNNNTGNGGTPHGLVMQDGKVVSNLEYNSVGGLIGFTNENKLILGKMSLGEAQAKGVRDAVTFGPFLIVNGKRSFIKGNGGWGSAPRTAIGQRQDGIVLFLVIDGRRIKYPGADMVDLTDILENYGVYNAANLDGGTSSVMVLPQEKAEKYLKEDEKKTHCRNNYCYINDPIDGGGSHETRWIATSFIVKE